MLTISTLLFEYRYIIRCVN